MMEAMREGVYNNSTKEDDSPTNEPNLMKRHNPDVKFHSPLHSKPSKNHTLHDLDESVQNAEVTDPKVLKLLLQALKQKANAMRRKPVYKHVHRNSTIAKGETENFKISLPKNDTNSEEVLRDILNKLKHMGDKGSSILGQVNEKFNNNTHNGTLLDMKGRHYSKPIVNYEDEIDRARRRKRHLILSTALSYNDDDSENDQGIEEV